MLEKSSMESVIKEFVKKVDKLADQKSESSISFSSKEENAIVLATIFKYAKEHVKMYVGDFNSSVSNEENYFDEYFSEQVKSYLQDGKSLDVIVNDDDPIHSNVFKRISLYSGIRDNVNIKHSSRNVLEGEEGNPIYFTVADGSMYRIVLDNKKKTGIACFNDSELSEKLESVFNNIFDQQASQEIG